MQTSDPELFHRQYGLNRIQKKPTKKKKIPHAFVVPVLHYGTGGNEYKRYGIQDLSRDQKQSRGKSGAVLYGSQLGEKQKFL